MCPQLPLRIAQIAENASTTRGLTRRPGQEPESRRPSFQSRLCSRLYNSEVLNTPETVGATRMWLSGAWIKIAERVIRGRFRAVVLAGDGDLGGHLEASTGAGLREVDGRRRGGSR